MFPWVNEKPGSGSSVRTALFNWVILGGFIFLVGPHIVGIFTPAEKEKPLTNAELIERFDITVVQPTPDPNADYAISTIKDPVIIITPTPQPDVYEYDYYTLRYSYYDPSLGGVNCHIDNWNEDKEICANTTASGRPWKSFVGVGVALHYDILFDLPFDTKIEVTKPEEIAGIYQVIDICPGCTPREDNDYYYIDFLDNQQRLPWGAEVEIRVKRKR